ncbi:MAG: phage distal tail protein, Rcc01695 family, partial [Paracoccaceae bacterium]
MSFHEIRFPASLSLGAVGGPERRTQIVTLASGAEERNTPWAHSRRRYDAGLGLRTLDDIETVIAFFEARRGQLHGFRWKDWSDYKSCPASRAPSHLDQVIGTGDGVTRVFKLVKAYPSGEQSYVRPIVKVVSGSVRMGVGGDPRLAVDDFAVDYDLGEVTFAFAP